MNRFALAAIALSAVAAAFTACAVRADDLASQQTPDTTIIVTATKTPTPISQVASSVTVITAGQLAATSQPFLLDALMTVPGITITQYGGVGTEAEVSIRSASPGDTLVLIDGAPVNNLSYGYGEYDLSTMTVDNIDHVEVLRGAQSTLYGSNATAGVINIITKRGHGKPVTKLTLDGGSYSTADGRIESAGDASDWGYAVSASQFYTSGFPIAAMQPNDSQHDGDRDTTLAGRADKQLSDALSLDITGRYIRATDQSTGYGSVNGTNEIALDDGVHTDNSEQITLGSQLNWRPANARWNSSVDLSLNTINSDYRDQPSPSYVAIDTVDGPGAFNGRMYRASWQATCRPSAVHRLTVGVGTEQDRVQANSTSYGVTVSPRTLTTNNAYVQDQLTLTKRWYSTLGARLEDNQQFGNHVTYTAGTNYNLRAGTTLKANYATGFKSPTIVELYVPNYGNPNLLPESSQTFDAGIEQAVLGGRGALSATYFDDLYFDMIGSGANYVYYNIGSVVADGAELSAAYHASPRFDCLVNYTYTWTKQNNGLPQPRVPEDLYSLSLQYRCTDTLNFDLNGEYVGKRYDMDYLSNPMLSPVPESLSSYTLINLAVQYKVRPNYKLFARIDNLTNVDYETIYSYRTPGRGIYGGITAQL